MSEENFLSRWSRRKTEARTEPAPAEEAPPVAQPVPDAATPPAKVAEPLPPVESLTFDSDFTAFMQPDVDPALRRQALKTLLQDPRFNVMDGLDVYIADYSKEDPLPEGWLEKMNQVKYLGIFKEPEEAAPDAPVPGDEAAQKAMAEQAVDAPAALAAPDISSTQISPPQVGKSPLRPEGDSDVLV
jgi:hypothetical protein